MILMTAGSLVGSCWPRARDRVRGERIELTVQQCEHGLEFLLDAALSADHS